MKLMQASLLALVVAAAACNPSTNPSSTTTDTDSTVAAAVPPVIRISSPSCYEERKAGDTFSLAVKVSDSSGVEGTLKYGFREKDSNTGTFTGMMFGDTLIADYHFQSEGTTSVREVAFLVTDSMAIEGYGDMEDKNGKLVFKDAHALTFGKGIMMKKTACAN